MPVAKTERTARPGRSGLAGEGTPGNQRPRWDLPTGTAVRLMLGLARHSADWESSPTALYHLANAFNERSGLPDVDVQMRQVNLNDPKALISCRVVLITANDPIVFSDAEIAGMRAYVDGGGVLWVNDSSASGDERFDQAIRNAFARLYPLKKLERLDPAHELFHLSYNLIGFKGYKIPPGDKYRAEFIEGLSFTAAKGIAATRVIYTRNDYADGLEIDPRNIAGRPSLTDLTADEMLEGSRRFGLNLIAYALGARAPRFEASDEGTAQFAKLYRYNGPPLPAFDDFRPAATVTDPAVWDAEAWANPTTVRAERLGNDTVLRISFKGGDKLLIGICFLDAPRFSSSCAWANFAGRPWVMG